MSNKQKFQLELLTTPTRDVFILHNHSPKMKIMIAYGWETSVPRDQNGIEAKGEFTINGTSIRTFLVESESSDLEINKKLMNRALHWYCRNVYVPKSINNGKTI